MNAEWHRAHVLGRNASLDDRVLWHVEHARMCACRPIPESIRTEMTKRDLEA